MAKMSSPETPAKTPTTHLVYADGHDAFDDAAWYINGERVGGRAKPTSPPTSWPESPPPTVEMEFLNWPATLEELRSLLAGLGA